MSDKETPQTSEEALAFIQEAAAAGNVEFASDTLAAQYDAEIQEIFREISIAHRARVPKRGIWTADRMQIGTVLDWDPETKEFSSQSLETCRLVSEKLGITLSPRSIWEEVAAELRDKRSSAPRS